MAPENVVVIPACYRSEFLALTLEKLNASRRPVDLDVRIFADTDANLDDVGYVRDEYYPEALIFHAKEHIFAPSGAWNILNALKSGYETGAERIILLEEDISVRPGFFDFHLNPANGHYLATCGRKDPRWYNAHPDIYTNPGSCLRRDLLAQVIPHINDDYFTRLRAYLDAHFGVWDEMSMLDDGLIRRVIRQMGGKVLYPESPVCVHQGWGFYNKLDIYKNDETEIVKKVARLRELISQIRPGDRYAFDFEF